MEGVSSLKLTPLAPSMEYNLNYFQASDHISDHHHPPNGITEKRLQRETPPKKRLWRIESMVNDSKEQKNAFSDETTPTIKLSMNKNFAKIPNEGKFQKLKLV